MSVKVFGISMVRNEVDIIRVNVQHHLSLGLDCLLIVDNGSSDGTDRELQRLSRDERVRWHRNDSPFHQSEITTGLAREAFRSGADWVVPMDADEFWWAPRRNFKEVLALSTAGAIRVAIVNFIQRRGQERASPEALLHMTRRVAQPIGPVERCSELVESRQISIVEMMYPLKWISRASETIEIAAGNHEVSGVEGSYEDTDEIICLHAPLRLRATLEGKADMARRQEEAGWPDGAGWQATRWRRLQNEAGLDEEWAANSYAGDWIDVWEARHQVIFDPTLRDVVAPWIWRPLWKRISSLWCSSVFFRGWWRQGRLTRDGQLGRVGFAG